MNEKLDTLLFRLVRFFVKVMCQNRLEILSHQIQQWSTSRTNECVEANTRATKRDYRLERESVIGGDATYAR